MDMQLTLIFRQYCSLCHKMRQELEAYQTQYGFSVNIVDVDENEALLCQYDELVPVLLDGDTHLCHWYLDHDQFVSYLNTRLAEQQN